MPRTVDVEERRAELAAAAARVIARGGLGAATMREVAAEAGWTTGALTHYFADKHELLAATLEASLAGRRARRASRQHLHPQAALRAALVSALPIDDATAQHWAVTLAFCAQASGDADLARLQRDAYREFRQSVADAVAAAGRATGGHAVAEAERLIAVVDGVALQALFDPESWPPARQTTIVDEALALEAAPHRGATHH